MASISQTPSIYQIRHIESGKVYVGSAMNPRKRWNEHIRRLRKGTHHSQYLQRAWEKYGESAFAFEIIEPVLFVEDLIVREQYWIDALHAANPVHGFNFAPIAGSSLGVKQTDERRTTNAKVMRELCADPVKRAQMKAQADTYWADPTNRARRSAQMKARWNDGSMRERYAEQMKAHYADPKERQQASELHKARIAANPEQMRQHSEDMREHYANPVKRLEQSARARKRWTNPDARARQSERSSALWKDPEYRTRVMDARTKRKKDSNNV